MNRAIAIFLTVLCSVVTVKGQSVYDFREINGDLRIIGAERNDRTHGIEQLDFNLDGKRDVVIASSGNSTLKILFNYEVYESNQLLDMRVVEEDVLIKGDYNGWEGIQIGFIIATGDINGDGNDDIITADIVKGTIYVIYADSGWKSGDVLDLSENPADMTLAYDFSEDHIWMGQSTLIIDINGDAIDDIAIDDINGLNSQLISTGSVYVIYGGSMYPENYVREFKSNPADITIYGETHNDNFGTSLGCGDVNGDDIEDIVIGSPNANYEDGRTGRAYCVFGRNDFIGKYIIDMGVEMPDVLILGPSEDSSCGHSVACGDVDNDGYDEIAVSALNHFPENEYRGSVHMLNGVHASIPGTIVDLSTTLADITIYGEMANGVLGIGMVMNDVNGDKNCDLMISGRESPETEHQAGVMYLFSGEQLYGENRIIELSEEIPAHKYFGENDDDEMKVRGTCADMDNDGLWDIVISSKQADRLDNPSAYDSGAIYLITVRNDLLSVPGIIAGPGPHKNNPAECRVYNSYYKEEIMSYSPFPLIGYGLNVVGCDINSNSKDEIVVCPGPGPNNPPTVLVLDSTGEVLWQFQAYGAPKYGVNIAAGDLNGDGGDEVITGAGPGAVYGPHVRGWTLSGKQIVPLGNVSFLAYGTNRWGVNVSAGDIDGDGFDEIVTGAGPGAVFGPHVRGWDVDSAAVTSISGVNFFAYGTLRWGVNVTSGDIDGDGIDEIVTGPGPSVGFGAHVRGWNYDGETISSIQGINFIAYQDIMNTMGCIVACGDVDNDRVGEILTAPGPYLDNPAYVKVWNYDGDELTLVESRSFLSFGEGYVAGAKIDFGNIYQAPIYLP